MHQETLLLIKESYFLATNFSNEIAIRLDYFYNLLLKSDNFPEEDEQTYNCFLKLLKTCSEYRRKSFDIKSIVTYFDTTLLYILMWLNTSQYNFNTEVFARCKSLKSDLTKLLFKATTNGEKGNDIRDRFGSRCIIENNDMSLIYVIFDAIYDILTNRNLKKRKEFIEWYSNSPFINPLYKTIISTTLDIPFDIKEEFIKDFIQNPKNNGYKSLQFTIEIPMYSNILPGCQFELQLRTREMEDIANYGIAAHDKYKESIPKRIKEVFQYENDSEQIVGISSHSIFFKNKLINNEIL